MKRDKAFSNKLLKILVVSGVITITAINPFFGVLAAHVAREELRKRKWKKIREDMYYLKRRGFVKIYQNPDGSYKVRSTTNGRRYVAKYFLGDVVIKIPKEWDRQWRFVIFDIPARKRKERLALLSKLKEFDFVMFQHSVWAHPFECQKEIEVLAKEFEISNYVQYLTCNKVSAGAYLKEEFEKRSKIKLL